MNAAVDDETFGCGSGFNCIMVPIKFEVGIPKAAPPPAPAPAEEEGN